MSAGSQRARVFAAVQYTDYYPHVRDSVPQTSRAGGAPASWKARCIYDEHDHFSKERVVLRQVTLDRGDALAGYQQADASSFPAESVFAGKHGSVLMLPDEPLYQTYTRTEVLDPDNHKFYPVGPLIGNSHHLRLVMMRYLERRQQLRDEVLDVRPSISPYWSNDSALCSVALAEGSKLPTVAEEQVDTQPDADVDGVDTEEHGSVDEIQRKLAATVLELQAVAAAGRSSCSPAAAKGGVKAAAGTASSNNS